MKKNILLKSALIILLCAVYCSSYGQLAQTLRKEMPLEDEYDHYAVPFSNTRSILYIFKNIEKKEKMKYWTLEFWNQDLVSIETKQIAMPRESTIELTYKIDDHYFILFFNRGKGIYNLFDINVENRTIKTIEGEFIKKMLLFEFVVVKDNVFISGEFKAKHQIFVLNMTTNKYASYVPQDMIQAKSSFNDLQVVFGGSQKEVVFKYKSCDKAGCDMYAKVFREDGSTKEDFIVIEKPSEDRELASVSFTKDGENSYLVTGTFGLKKGGQVGFYFSRITNSKNEFIKYYNFLDLANFNSHLSQKQQDKIEKKAGKAEEKGEELFINYLATIHDVVQKNGEYILLSEFYYPTYRTETYTTTGSNGQTITRTRQVFDGFQYTHAAVAGFDKQGNMQWSNTFEMWLNQKPFRVRQFVRATYKDNSVDLVFVTGSQIKSMSFVKGKIENEINVSQLEAQTDQDVIKRTTNSEIDYWFGQNYLSTGYQLIKNDEEERGKRKRRIFYISRLTY